jgi:glyoxylase I family protein
VLTRAAHHISLNVRDVAPARAFYGDLLGLPEIERPDLGIPGVWYQAGEVQLHLIVPPSGVDVGAAAAKMTPLANHVAFAIDDYEEVRSQLEAKGLEVIALGAEAGQMFVRDPDGNLVEFIRPRRL